MPRRGLMFVLSSPSGAGKTSLAKRLLASDGNLFLSVSMTTRPKREGEVEGRDYYFTSRPSFEIARDGGELLEHADVHDNLYGTPRAPVEKWLAEGRDVLFDIDWQGAKQIVSAMPRDIATVFILPPSMEALEARLVKRGKDAPEVIARRLRNAAAEIERSVDYDYVIVNEEIDAAEEELRAILSAERLRCARRTGLPQFVDSLAAAGKEGA
ncbi:MAG: guanylate kinase [Neomegalonema sp.]|nr:guanylate kinase [Neomegalonema sp.]